jgi:hypothetical protein
MESAQRISLLERAVLNSLRQAGHMKGRVTFRAATAKP